MRKRGLRFLAALLAVVMLVCSDGVYALADTIDGGSEVIVIDEDAQVVDVTTNDVTDNGETVIPEETDVEVPADDIIEEETEPASFVDDFGNVITYDANESYTYTIESGVLTGITTADGNPVSGTVVISEGKGITAIAASAFSGNEDVTYVKVPTGVTGILEDAFEGCSALKGISLPKGVTEIEKDAFKDCTSLTQFKLPKTVETIGAAAFSGASKLYIVYTDDADYSALTTISDSAFEGCSSLTYFCSDSKVVFPTSLTTIGEKAFKGCSSITTLPFGQGITSIGAYAFAECTEVTSVEIPEKLTAISPYTFAGCKRLSSVIWASKCKEIGEGAFENCFSLGKLDCKIVNKIGKNAFIGCTSLVSIIFRTPDIDIEDTILPSSFKDGHKLYVYGNGENCSIDMYCRGKANLQFVDIFAESENSTLYKWESYIIGKGSVSVTNADGTDPNAAGGIEEGNLVYVTYKATTGYTLKAGSLKMNGQALTLNEENKYTFEMPKGGALITAEFVLKSVDNRIEGTDFSVQFTNGDVSALTSNQLTLKLGESSKAILVDAGDGNVIPASKISFEYVTDTSKTVATIDKNGIIKTLKKGTSKVKATVTGQDGIKVSKVIVIVVEEASISQLAIKVNDCASVFNITDLPSGIQEASVNTVDLKSAYQINLKATAYNTDDKSIGVELTWATTDSKVAKLASTTTASTSMYNTVTVPMNARGEATITVTAKKSDGTTITQKFLVSAQDYTPRIPTAEIVVNPNLETEGTLRIIEAYGAELVDPEAVRFVYSDNTNVPDEDGFVLEYVGLNTDGYHEYKIKTTRSNIEEGTYKKTLELKYKKGASTHKCDPYPTVTLKVNKSVPKPTVTISSSYSIDTLYKNDGTVVKPKITGLSGAKVASYSLEALSEKSNDLLFLENFEIDENTGCITQKSTTLKKTSGGKYAVSGYLVMTFVGYKETSVVKKKITIPTKQTEINYALSATSGTFNDIAADTEVVLTVTNKSTKKVVDLSDTTKGTYNISVQAGSILGDEDVAINEDGKIVISVPSNPDAGSVKMKLTNDSWASNKYVSLTYKINTSGTAPKISLSSSKITVNSLYPEETKTFTLVSNQKDTNLLCEQTFVAKSTSKTASQYAKLSVTYDDETGIGTVKVLDSSIKAGDYTYTCKTKRLNKSGTALTATTVTLKVTVVGTKPSAKLSTTKATLNQKAVSVSENDSSFADTATVTIKTTKLPETYTIDEASTVASLKCTTTNKSYFADCVDMSVSGKTVSFKLNQEVNSGSYTLSFVPAYKCGENIVKANAVKLSVKVYTGTVSVSLKASGTINLLNRVDPEAAKAAYYPTDTSKKSKLLFTSSNSIIYTPTITNINDKIVDVKIFAASGAQPNPETDAESAYFNATVLGGKIYISPKAGVNLANGKSYKIMLFMQFENYNCNGNKGIMSKVLTVKTAQKLPAVEKLSSIYNLYLSKKSNTVTFTVKSSSSSAKLESIAFGEKDDIANSSFDVAYVAQSDGSLKVTLKLKDSVAYKCGSTNTLTLYAKYKNQGTNSEGVETKVSVKINK